MRREARIAAALVLAGGLALVVWRAMTTGAASQAGSQATTAASSTPPAPSAASAAPVAVPAPTVVATVASSMKLGWGTGDNQLGHERRQEGDAEGPMSLATDKDGNALVLDQVNGRIVKIGPDGKTRATIKLPVTAAQDLAVGDDGKMAVLDRLSDKTVAIMGPDGKVIGNLPLEGQGVAESGGVTGVFMDGNDVYAEYEHGSLVLLGDTSGNAAADRTEIPGRPSRDGKTIWSAGITDGPAGRLWLSAVDRATMQNRFTRELGMGMPVRTIVLLDTDKQGVVYLGADVEAGQEAVLLTCFAPTDGHALGSVELPANTMPEESMRDFAVLDDGGVLYAHRTDAGVTIGRYDCR
jgi:hypothetical protein